MHAGTCGCTNCIIPYSCSVIQYVVTATVPDSQTGSYTNTQPRSIVVHTLLMLWTCNGWGFSPCTKVVRSKWVARSKAVIMLHLKLRKRRLSVLLWAMRQEFKVYLYCSFQSIQYISMALVVQPGNAVWGDAQFTIVCIDFAIQSSSYNN